MKIYRLHYTTTNYGSSGYQYYNNKAEADLDLRVWKADFEDNETEGAVIEVFEFPVTEKGILMALNRLGGHPDNG